MGDTKVGPFEISADAASEMLKQHNPHGKHNSDVVRPWMNGLDITRHPREMWIIDFPPGTTIEEASLYESPFEYINRHVRPMRATARSGDRTGVPWWIHQRPRPDMRRALNDLPRYIATPTLTKHRLFVWLDKTTLPDHQLIAIARDDDYTFGVFHSRAHRLWALSKGTQLKDRPRYTPTTTFETFPFPGPLNSSDSALSVKRRASYDNISHAAKNLDNVRRSWLNPKNASEEALKSRTLTILYNTYPTWLNQAHSRLDEAVLGAYGWSLDIRDNEILANLLALNLEQNNQ
jgi:hypothetical protein